MEFDMAITDNYAAFIDKVTGKAVFVDSFDNKEFEVRIGTINESEPAGSIIATTSEELSAELAMLFSAYEHKLAAKDIL